MADRIKWQDGLLRAAEIADLYADECMRMADDTITMDPIINRDLRRNIKTESQLEEAWKFSQRLISEGSYYAARSHAAADIAEAIRREIKDGD